METLRWGVTESREYKPPQLAENLQRGLWGKSGFVCEQLGGLSHPVSGSGAAGLRGSRTRPLAKW